MPAGFSSDLADFVIPPERSAVLAITLDATARAYDLGAMLFGQAAAPDPSGLYPGHMVYLRLKSVTAVTFYYFAADNTVTLDKTAAISAGGAIATANTYGDQIQAGASEDIIIDRTKHRYIHVQGSGAGTLIIRASSAPG